MVDFWFSSALSDDAKAVVLEIPEAIRATLDQLHLAVEPFGNPVVACEPPHAGDGFYPVLQGVCERLQGRCLVLSQVPDACQQTADVFLALFFALEFVVHEFAQPVHFLVQGFKDRMGSEELFEP